MTKVCFSSPSNIAFVKYWGKYGRQMPMNPSISMTLSNCRTICSIEYSLEKGQGRVESFLFEGSESKLFEEKISKFIKSVEDIFPLGKDLVLNISTSNTFPHSSGIASSASAMSALCRCLTEIEKNILELEYVCLERTSELSRLASGSACRSLYSAYASWGASKEVLSSTNDYATPYINYDESFKSVCDTVLIVSSGKKDVSSSAGHKLMDDHPFKEGRIKQANSNFENILMAMKEGDWSTFGEILENEALTLHALMMSSTPSFTLLKDKSLAIIERVKEFRSSKGASLYFTIDAGPNIHLIYPESEKLMIQDFINSELKQFCENGYIIHDEIGFGAREEN